MAKICYEAKKFSPEKELMINRSNDIIADYNSQGYDLTVRQLYYQFVSRDWLPNRPEQYAKLQGLLSEARLAGRIDWDAIIDRTRGLRSLEHFAHPRDSVIEASRQFRLWKWEDQPNYVEVWVEKDALAGVVGGACNRHDVPYFSCRGYSSITELHGAALRLGHEVKHGKTARIIHLGDHDPSGCDMTRNIKDRLNSTFGVDVKVYRVALNMDQIQRYNPPPNPVKLTDSRKDTYIANHGDFSWELDALEPSILDRIIEANILHWRDEDLYAKAAAKEARAKDLLTGIHDRWNEVVRMLKCEPREVE